MDVKEIQTKAKESIITREYLKTLFDYDEEGFLVWKVNPRNQYHSIGKRAGSLTRFGYYAVSIKNQLFKLHRLIWIWHNGEISKFVDHIDRNRLNNRIQNLRQATACQNAWNMERPKKGTSKYVGVHRHMGKWWLASIAVKNKKIHIGIFDTEELAALAYNEKAVLHHGEFAKINVI